MPLDIDDTISKAEELCVLCEEEEAEDLIRSALSKNPNNLDLKTELAIILSRRGFDTKAEKILASVLEKDAFHMRAVSALGNLFENSLRSSEAESLFRAFLAERPHGHMILDDLCRFLYDNERVDEALKLARNHVEFFPSELAAYDALRYVLARQEDDLAAEVVDHPEDISKVQMYVENIIEQYDNLRKMRMGNLSIDIGKEDIMEDIEEDMLRIAGEILDVRDRLDRFQIKLADEIMNKLAMIE